MTGGVLGVLAMWVMVSLLTALMVSALLAERRPRRQRRWMVPRKPPATPAPARFRAAARRAA